MAGPPVVMAVSVPPLTGAPEGVVVGEVLVEVGVVVPVGVLEPQPTRIINPVTRMARTIYAVLFMPLINSLLPKLSGSPGM